MFSNNYNKKESLTKVGWSFYLIRDQDWFAFIRTGENIFNLFGISMSRFDEKVSVFRNCQILAILVFVNSWSWENNVMLQKYNHYLIFLVWIIFTPWWLNDTNEDYVIYLLPGIRKNWNHHHIMWYELQKTSRILNV